MSTIIKALTAVGSIGAVGCAGVATTYFLSGDSIKEHIEKTKKSPNKVFITSDSLEKELQNIKTKYTENTKKTKPENVNADELVKWCTDNVNAKFSNDKDPTYLAILSWCFVNPNSISQELEFNKKELWSDGDSDKEWKIAWDAYNAKDKANIVKIDDSTLSTLDVADNIQGGLALKKWCTDKKREQKKLYEENFELVYEFFEAFCTKDKQ